MLVHDALRNYLGGPEDAAAPKKDALRKSLNENRNEEGSPLLHLVAALHSDEALIFCKLLADKIGADFDKITDKSGRTVRAIAAANSNAETIKWAKSAGAFLGRYQLSRGPPIHKSPTCIVIKAEDVKMDEYFGDEFAKNNKGGGSSDMDKSNFRQALQAMNLISDKRNHKDEGLTDEFFHKVDTDKTGAISKSEFIQFCSDEFGRHVAIKFMQKPDQFKRELEGRRDLNGKHVMKIIRSHDLSLCATDLAKSVSSFLKPFLSYNDEDAGAKDDRKPEDYLNLIVMPFGDRNLDTIFRSERPDAVDVRSIMKQVGESLAHLHHHGLVHGDVKMLNVVRSNNRYVLIDLDASTRKDLDASAGKDDYIGAKFSSGVLPPEMIYCLSGHGEVLMFKKYYENEDVDEKLKREPKFSTQSKKKGYVVRSFLTKEVVEEEENDDTGNIDRIARIVPRDKELLPYKLVRADCKMDVWSFGVLLYTLCTGGSMFKVNRDDDIEDGKQTGNLLRRLLEWDEEELRSDLEQSINDTSARELIRMILRKQPEDRPTMKDVLSSDFFDLTKQVNLQVILDKMQDGHEEVIENLIENREIMRNEFLFVRKSLNRVHERQMAVSNMLKSTIEGKNFPKYFAILPTEEATGFNSLLEMAKPTKWVTNKVILVFFCPITLQAVIGSDGKAIGYPVEMPKGWVKKYGASIIFGLKILEASLLVGRLCGLPIPSVSGAANGVESKLSEASTFVENMQQVLVEEFGGEDNNSVADIVISKFNAAGENAVSKFEESVSSESPLSASQQEAIQESYEGIGDLIKDEAFGRCGLEQVVANDGTIEFVHPDIVSYFREHGQECVKTRVEDIEEEAAVQSAMGQAQAVSSGEATDVNAIIHKGWLQKQSRSFGLSWSWKERYFVLYENGTVVYFRNDSALNDPPNDGHSFPSTKWDRVENRKEDFVLRSEQRILKVCHSNRCSSTIEDWLKGNLWQ